MAPIWYPWGAMSDLAPTAALLSSTRARLLLRRAAAAFALVALSCGPGKADHSQAPAESEEEGTGGDTAKLPYTPGGMWMPSQMPAQAETLKKTGFEIGADALADPTAFPLGAIVSLGGCSASFVSPDGLIVTNHHCVTGALQFNSKGEDNLLVQGYLAKTRADEKWAGPTARVYVTRGFTNVTDQVLGGLADDMEPKARYDEIERRIKTLTAACEKDRPEIRCRVASYFEGAEYHQIEQLEIRDVRLVYAPHAGVGVFGGEVDNWRWPRHTGDFSFLRAYVGKDGKPADHAADNVPFQPPHHLKIASAPLRPGDAVLVAGYPGRTYRLKTAAEVREAVELTYPHEIEMFEQYIALLEDLGKQDPEILIKVASRLRGLNNYLTNFRGMLDGLVQGGLADTKNDLEQAMLLWIAGDPERSKKYGGVIEEMNQIFAQQRETWQRDTAETELVRASALLGQALAAVNLAHEKAKPDAQRRPRYQERNWPRLEQSARALSRRYDRRVDRAVLKMFTQRALARPPKERPVEVLAALLGKDAKALGAADPGVTAAEIDAALDRLYAGTRLEDEKARLKLLKVKGPAKLRRSKDPFVRLALALRPHLEAQREASEAEAGRLSALRPRYIEALRAFHDGPLAPDANSTLRITYGTVRGYRAPGKDEPYAPFSTVSEMVAKHTGKEPFIAPKAVLAAAKAGNWGPYADGVIGEVPLDFLADLDITGGNSGSATLNARGELVGLAFDGNYESIASDWLFMPEVTRSIHVDTRYMMWIMDAVDGADHLLEEMGVSPSL